MKIFVCPKCGKKCAGYPALSRRDNKTEICAECGLKEALADWAAAKKAEKGGKNE